ncbi:MAG: glycosyltransferase [Bacteroidales bacterium]|nr:glycosyltransferase [Bacteroidales bacterium]
MENPQISLLWIFSLLFITSAVIQLIYYWVVFSKFAFYKPSIYPQTSVPVSVVISAKNEYPNLRTNLPLILEQEYASFEVVVVNDASDDETIFLLEDLKRAYSHLKVVNIEKDLNFFKGKKFPLALGIKSATYENLLLTDADCKPASKYWICEMAKGFSKDNEVVLGYGKLASARGWLNKIIRYETVFTALQYFSLAMWGMPYMGVGRNLAYKKTLFLKNKGFIAHYKVSSGDDDLFINKVAHKKNTSIVISPESFTISPAKKTWSEWWRQKRRHLSTGNYYKLKHKFILGTYSTSLFGFYFLLIILLSAKYMVLFSLGILLLRTLSQYLIFYKTCRKFSEKKLLVFSPLIEILLALIYPVMVISNLVFKESRWK